jgi:hypothetical protein
MTPVNFFIRPALLLCFVLSANTLVIAADRPVTPYGDYCGDCAVYGACREPVALKQAMHSLRKYYETRGYRLGTVSHSGRFIEVEIFQDNRLVDKALFDRKTGRLRSMY